MKHMRDDISIALVAKIPQLRRVELQTQLFLNFADDGVFWRLVWFTPAAK